MFAPRCLPVFLFALSSCAAGATAVVYEAERATLVGGTRIAHEHADGGGRSWVTGFVTRADAVEFTVRAPAAGDYRLELVYSADGDKHIPVTLGGEFLGSRRMPKTDGFETRDFGRVVLAEGVNRLRVGTDWGYVDLDAIRVAPAEPPVAFDLAAAPVNPAASPEARALFTRLVDAFGRRTFSGQHESDVRQPQRLRQLAALTDGAAPAILGLDLQLDSSAWTNPEPVGAVDRALDWAKNHGGIVTLSWHWLSPFGGKRDPVWDDFSTKETTFDVSRIADEESAEYAAMLRDIDLVAGKLAVLRDAGVPVLWRPLHEAQGGWFWWGAKGPGPARALYRLMFDRFTRVHGLDNLLWVWTATDDDDAPDWYPGDKYVDVVAADLYSPAGERGDYFTVFDRLREQHGGRKPLALGECGAIPSITSRAPWLWFLVWDDHLVRPDFNPADVIRKTYRDPRVLTAPAR